MDDEGELIDPGQIVILNGAPRAGKSSIVAVIQETFDGQWMNLGVDQARQTTPAQYQPGIGLRPGEPNHTAAPFVGAFFAAWYESIAAHSRAGLNVVVDVGHHDGDPRGLRATLGGTAGPIRRNPLPHRGHHGTTEMPVSPGGRACMPPVHRKTHAIRRRLQARRRRVSATRGTGSRR